LQPKRYKNVAFGVKECLDICHHNFSQPLPNYSKSNTMKKNLKQFIVASAFLMLAASFTSCNRGYGCPTNFSVNEIATEVVKTTITTLFTNR